MTTKKKNTSTAKQSNSNPDAFKVTKTGDTTSQALAKLATNSVLSAVTLKSYVGGGDAMEVSDLVAEMKQAGNEAVAGDLGRVERMLANQVLTLDAIFNDMAQRSRRQDTFKGIEVMLRLALKAQAQARATAETLSIIKNPMPYIKQANIAHGHQQVNNGQQPASAGNFKSEPNKLLEVNDGNVLDFGAQAAPGRADQALEALGAVDRSKNARGKSDGGK
jgi:hypothetical protein